jgi:hypothetical protein
MTAKRHRVRHAIEDRTLAARVVATRSLVGISAGSALLSIGERLLAVRDDAFCVTWIERHSLDLEPWVLQGDGAPLPKAVKPDFESAVVTADDAVHLLGSGSTPERCSLARLDVATRAVRIRRNVALYACVRDALALDTRPNVEAAIIVGERLRVFHRGVGGRASGAVDLPLDVLDDATPRALTVQWFDLGVLDDIPLGVTDVAAIDGARLAFVAAAEDTADAVSDGPVAGSVLGLVATGGAGSMARWTRLLDADGRPLRRKVEGLVVDADGRGGWILTDSDDARAPAELCRIELEGFRADRAVAGGRIEPSAT